MIKQNIANEIIYPIAKSIINTKMKIIKILNKISYFQYVNLVNLTF